MKIIGISTSSDFHNEKEYHKKFLRPDVKSLLVQKNKFLEQFSHIIESCNYQPDFKYSKREIQKLKILTKKYDAIDNALLMNKINTHSIDSLLFSRLDSSFALGDKLPNDDIVIKCTKIHDRELKKNIPAIVTFANTEKGLRFKLYRNDKEFLNYIPKIKKQYNYFIQIKNIDGINALNKKCYEAIKDYEIGEVFIDISLCCHNHNKIVISAKGNVFLCSMYEADDTTLGNLYEQNFYEIWENRFNTPYFQKRDMTTTKCKNCKYIALCGTGCMASAYKKYGDINAAPAECSYYEEYLKEQNEQNNHS